MTTPHPADPAMTDEEIERLCAASAAGQIELAYSGTADQPDILPRVLSRLTAEIAARKEAEGLYAREGHKALVLQEALSAAEARAALVDALRPRSLEGCRTWVRA